MCIQETAIYPYLTGKENLELIRQLVQSEQKSHPRAKQDAAGKNGFNRRCKPGHGKYSGGMKRRLSLAIALIHDPAVTFLDEPTVAMDPQSRHAVWDFIKELKAHGKTIILTTHYMEEAEELCDSIAILDHGKLISLGTPKELIAKNGVKNLEDVFISLTGRKMREDV